MDFAIVQSIGKTVCKYNHANKAILIELEEQKLIYDLCSSHLSILKSTYILK